MSTLSYFAGVLSDEERFVLEEALNVYIDELHSWRHDHPLKVALDVITRREGIASELIKWCQP